ncbi:bile acid:sodium symporter [Paracoccus sp. YIM 132242]|uniref:Bile acid:sodium symporter n=1 Tax=Paracoccus lichenicola TaxID=2665644 RepID=A0A6L6HQ17_9RHOB|nr:bile acid:sodium symporter family protein [Paracoccus lichenicola]MTE01267.1 bile acid:sodium symporter [Paracoccus lichenicola]
MSLRRAEAVLARFGLDRYMLLLVLTVAGATVLPARGDAAAVLSHLTHWVVALLFFLYGAKLTTATILAGLTNWRLQLAVLALTFVLFPVLALALKPVSMLWLPAAVGVGFLYIGCMPSTVQSSIAFTAVSGGNVAGAVCAASMSNLIGVVLSPLLFAWLIPQGSGYGIDPGAVWKIVQQILLPFAGGQLCRPLLAGLLNRYRTPTIIVDRGSILLIVYAAFSAGVVNGIWQVIGAGSLAILVALCLVLLAAVMGGAMLVGRAAGLDRADGVAVLYCGSTKSLATGLPMAGILFAGQDISLIILPLMLFHLLQLGACAIIAQRMARRLDLR